MNTQSSENSNFSNGQINAAAANLPAKVSIEESIISPPSLTSRGLDITSTMVRQRSGQSPLNLLGRFNWGDLSLRYKATVLAIALGTLPVLGIGSAAYMIANQSITKQVNAAQESSVSQVAGNLNAFMFERYGDIQALANLPVFQNPKVAATMTPAEKSALLTRYAEIYGIYDSIAAFYPNGNVMVQSQSELLDNHANRSYFQTAVKTGMPVISSPELVPATGKLAVHIATPLKDAAGKIFGVIRTRMPVDVALPILIEEFKLQTNQYYLLDETGKVFLSNQPNQTGKSGAEILPDITAVRSPGKQGTVIGADPIQKREHLIGYISTTNYREMPSLKWTVVKASPIAERFKPQQELLFALTLGIGLAAVVVSILATYLANRATRPIRTAAETVEQIGQGDLAARIDVSGTDELAVLGANINKMAAEIELLVDNQKAETERIETARQEARQEADAAAQQQREAKELLQKRALELLMEVDPVSRGDLTVRAKVTADEIGTVADSYNAIIRSLRQIVTQVQGATQTVTATAQANESAVKLVATEATQQAMSISQALLQIEMLTETSQGMSERAKQAEVQVQLANQVVQAGDMAMNRTVSGISAIRETVSETAKKVKRLGDASQKISKVVNLISGFAAQTNLLALNAAIEAARAGEEGRGFSVVAEEVRALAQQSAAATADIEQLVEEIQTQTNEVVTAMETGTEQVVAGSQLVEESRQQLSQISQVSLQVNQLIQEIAQAAASQTENSTTVRQTMQDVATIATDTSQQSEDVANSFSQLLEVAKALQVSVAQFKVN